MKHSRRNFIKFVGLSSLATLTPAIANTSSVPHIVVVGGGFAGATCAKYLKLWGGSKVNVTIIEPNSTYISPILSNLVLNGQKTTSELSFNYNMHQSKYEIKIIHSTVVDIDKTNQKITLESGENMEYTKLVLAPGIDFIQSNSYDFTKIPHAWQAGEQTNLLKAQIDGMVDGDTFVITIPKAPYRCPPGPYERACVVADYLKNTKGFTSAKVVVLDANANITIEEETFSSVFAKYGIEYKSSCTITNIDDTTKTITFSENGVSKSLSPKVLNVIPEQKAASIIFQMGLNSGNWAPVNVLSYESTITNNIHIIGDSQGTGQPKAGHIGNSEAKICADAILRILGGVALYPTPKTNSACYSPISSNEASWLSGVFTYDTTTQSMVLVNIDDGKPSTQNYQAMFKWSQNLFSDTFA
jgi:NADPH-dependent 2,4-dienoyl-CoA reductase/sulfur reductase-like enzyme